MTTEKTITERLLDVATAPPFNMTKKGFAEAIGMSYEGVRKWGLPSGASRPNASTLARISEVLGSQATPEWVLFGLGPGPSNAAGDSSPKDEPENMKLALLLSIPLLAWSEVGLVSLPNDDPALSKTRRVMASRSATKRTKQIEVPDDSMAPTLLPGDAVQVEPGETPQPGDVVLVKDGAGKHYIREYRERPRTFEAHPHNPVFSTLEAVRDGLVVAAVATHYVRPLRRKT